MTPLPKLIKKAQSVFNAWIRKRDEGKPCISCGTMDTAHASHYFSAGQFPAVRFDTRNVNASCVKCNTYLHGNLIMYRIGLCERIGEDKVQEMEHEATANRLKKWTREELETIIQTYK